MVLYLLIECRSSWLIVQTTAGGNSLTSGNWSLALPDDVIADSIRTTVNVIGKSGS